MIEPDDGGGADPIEVAFWKFHRENPQVYDALRRLAYSLIERGHEHYGIKALCEVVRFEHVMAVNDPAFKINNNHTALYARLLMANEKRLDGFFDTRERISRRTMRSAEERISA